MAGHPALERAGGLRGPRGRDRYHRLARYYEANRQADGLAHERSEARHALAWHVARLGGGDRDWDELLDEWRAADEWQGETT